MKENENDIRKAMATPPDSPVDSPYEWDRTGTAAKLQRLRDDLNEMHHTDGCVGPCSCKLSAIRALFQDYAIAKMEDVERAAEGEGKKRRR